VCDGECWAQLAQQVRDEAGRRSWIAARFDDGQLPAEMIVGDGRTLGDYINRPLTKRRAYKIFVRAFTAENVSNCGNFHTFFPISAAGLHTCLTALIPGLPG